MRIEREEDPAVILGRIDERLSNIEKRFDRVDAVCVTVAVLQNDVDAIKAKPASNSNATLADHEARIKANEADIKSIFDRAWVLIAAVFVALIGAVVSLFKPH